jgi:acyl-CoA synthetase (AMP-forming)/AMP-acid ligase II
VPEVLDRALSRSPDHEFVVGRRGRLSYAEFDTLANQTAHYLASLGVGPRDRVAASLPTDIDIALVFHGTLRLGALWLGINRNLAPPEKQFILEDSGAKVLVADPEMAEQVEPLRATLPALTHVVRADRDVERCEYREALDHASSKRPEVEIDRFDPAALAYTSGTTGFPKGVVHSHHNLLLQGASQVPTYGFGPETRRGDCFPLTILNLHVLSHLMLSQAGGTCIFMDRVDAKGIAEWIHRERVSNFTGAPAQLYSLARDPEILPEHLASLQTVYTGGADCPETIFEAFHERFGIRVSATYGLTEAPTAVTLDPPDGQHVAGASGVALPHLDVTIRDDDDNEVPLGESGQVCVGPKSDGPWKDLYTPMLGYWKRPEATAETLRGGRLHTGDMGRLDADGQLYIVDRKSLLILRGGANVYPAEVERVLQEDPRVEASAVVGVPDERLGERVGAFVELAAGAQVDAETLRALCLERLARYKVPERIEFIERLPRNAMNKIERAKLKQMCADWKL